MRSIGALALLSPLACQSKIHTKTVAGAQLPEAATEAPQESVPQSTPPSTATPVTIDGGFEASRARLQTRAPIVLAMKAPLAEPGNRITVVNETTGVTLIDDQVLDPLASLRFYPLDPAYPERFVYGTNRLRLLVQDDGTPRLSYTSIDRHDFALFVPAGGSFAAEMQRAEGLELIPGGFGQPSVTNGQGVLTVDPISMLSR